MARFEVKVTERDRDVAHAAALQCSTDQPTCATDLPCEYSPKSPRPDPVVRKDPAPRAKRPVSPLSE